jgi:hypothetical protein
MIDIKRSLLTDRESTLKFHHNQDHFVGSLEFDSGEDVNMNIMCLLWMGSLFQMKRMMLSYIPSKYTRSSNADHSTRVRGFSFCWESSTVDGSVPLPSESDSFPLGLAGIEVEVEVEVVVDIVVDGDVSLGFEVEDEDEEDGEVVVEVD